MSIFNSRGSLICALFTAFTVVLSGCASTGSSLLSSDSTITTASGEVISVDPRLTEGDEAKFFSRSGFQACTASAAVGILACMVSNSSNKALCSVAAGVAACGVAMGTNYYFDQRRAQYSNTATRLDKIDEDIKSDTNRIVKRTETAQAVINDNKKTLAQINADIKKQQLDKAQAERSLAQIDLNITALKKDLQGMNSKIGQYREVAQMEAKDNGVKRTQELDKSIAQMNQKVASLQSEVDELYTQRSAITLG